MSTFYQNLLQSVIADGARSTKWEVEINIDSSIFVEYQNIPIMAKTSSFPGLEHSTTDIKFKGRSIPVKSQIKYTQTWDCTFYLTENHKLKKAFHDWIINQDIHNYSGSDVSEINNNYYTDIVIKQLNFDLDEERSAYKLYNCFPINISNSEINYESLGEVLEFTVTFAYSYFEQVSIDESLNAVEQFKKDVKDKLQSAADSIISGAQEVGSNITSERTDSADTKQTAQTVDDMNSTYVSLSNTLTGV